MSDLKAYDASDLNAYVGSDLNARGYVDVGYENTFKIETGYFYAGSILQTDYIQLASPIATYPALNVQIAREGVTMLMNALFKKKSLKTRMRYVNTSGFTGFSENDTWLSHPGWSWYSISHSTPYLLISSSIPGADPAGYYIGINKPSGNIFSAFLRGTTIEIFDPFNSADTALLAMLDYGPLPSTSGRNVHVLTHIKLSSVL